MYKVQCIGSWGPPISCKFRSGSTCIIKLLNLKISLTQCSVALNALTFHSLCNDFLYFRQSIRRPVLNHCENLRNCEISEQEIKDLPPELHADVAEQCMEGGQ